LALVQALEQRCLELLDQNGSFESSRWVQWCYVIHIYVERHNVEIYFFNNKITNLTNLTYLICIGYHLTSGAGLSVGVRRIQHFHSSIYTLYLGNSTRIPKFNWPNNLAIRTKLAWYKWLKIN
jgi:hypothetical protein